MKLLTSDQFELMEVTGLKTEGKNLVVVGTIMGAMPTEAILTPVELRKVFKLLNFRTFAFVLKMLVSA
jgi:hypothetical protein